MSTGRTPSHNLAEADNPTATYTKSSAANDGSHDVMVVEIPPTTMGKASVDSAKIPSAAGRETTVSRMDSMEVPPGTTAAMAVTGKQSTSESGESDATTTRQPATN